MTNLWWFSLFCFGLLCSFSSSKTVFINVSVSLSGGPNSLRDSVNPFSPSGDAREFGLIRIWEKIVPFGLVGDRIEIGEIKGIFPTWIFRRLLKFKNKFDRATNVRRSTFEAGCATSAVDIEDIDVCDIDDCDISDWDILDASLRCGWFIEWRDIGWQPITLIWFFSRLVILGW